MRKIDLIGRREREEGGVRRREEEGRGKPYWDVIGPKANPQQREVDYYYWYYYYWYYYYCCYSYQGRDGLTGGTELVISK